MVETYGASQTRLYYVVETVYGETPGTPTVIRIKAESIDPGVDPSNIRVRGIGDYDWQTIKRGTRAPQIGIIYPLPSDDPIDFLQYCKADLNKSLSMEVLYYKGAWASATNIISLLFAGVKFNRVSVECHIEDVIKATADLWAKKLTVGAAKIDGATYNDLTGAVAFHESYIKKDTSTLERVTDWVFNVENNLKRVPVIQTTDGYLLKYLPFRHRNLSGQLTFEFESKEEFDDVIADEEFDLEFGLGGTQKAIISDCKWDKVVTPARIEDLISLNAPFVGKGLAISTS